MLLAPNFVTHSCLLKCALSDESAYHFISFFDYEALNVIVNQLLQFCTACIAWFDTVVKFIFVLFGKCTTLMGKGY